MTPLNEEGLRAAEEAIGKILCPDVLARANSGVWDIEGGKKLRKATEAAIRAYLEHDDGWLPIELLHNANFSGDILVSDGKAVTVMEWHDGEEDWNAAQQWPTKFQYLPTPPKGSCSSSDLVEVKLKRGQRDV